MVKEDVIESYLGRVSENETQEINGKYMMKQSCSALEDN